MLASEDNYDPQFQTALALYGEEMAFERRATCSPSACSGSAHGGAPNRAALHEALTLG